MFICLVGTWRYEMQSNELKKEDPPIGKGEIKRDILTWNSQWVVVIATMKIWCNYSQWLSPSLFYYCYCCCYSKQVSKWVCIQKREEGVSRHSRVNGQILHLTSKCVYVPYQSNPEISLPFYSNKICTEVVLKLQKQ